MRAWSLHSCQPWILLDFSIVATLLRVHGSCNLHFPYVSGVFIGCLDILCVCVCVCMCEVPTQLSTPSSFSSCTFFYWVVCLFVLMCRSSIHILFTSPLLDIFLQISFLNLCSVFSINKWSH